MGGGGTVHCSVPRGRCTQPFNHPDGASGSGSDIDEMCGSSDA